MASTYGNDLRLEEIGDGEQSGTWGATTNTNLELIAEALSFGTEAITTNADTHTTTIADGATDPGRSLYLKYTGTLDSTCTITIAPNSISKTWYIENGTSGSQSIIISQGSGANVTIPTGQTKIVYSDGAGSGAAMAEIGTLGVTNLNVSSGVTVGGNATVGGTLGVTGVLTGTSLDISGDIDVDGTSNLDVVDIDGALTQDGGAVFNEASADVDFRVESDGNTHSLFVEGSSGNVLVGTTDTTLYNNTTGTGTKLGGDGRLDVARSADTVATFNRTGSSNGEILRIISSGTTLGGIESISGDIALTSAANPIRFSINNSEKIRFGAAGQLGIGGANYGTSGQILTSGGASAAPTWAEAGGGGGEQEFTASGSITAGNIVGIKPDGTVAVCEQESSGVVEASTANPYYDGDQPLNGAFDGTSKIVVTYREQADSNRIKAVVGTVNGTAITFGSVVNVDSTTNQNFPTIVYDSNAGKFLFVWVTNTGAPDTMYAVVGTVSGTSITFGTRIAVSTNVKSSVIQKLVYDDYAQKSVVVYREVVNAPSARVLTISGTSVSAGALFALKNTTSCYYMTAAYDSTANRTVAVYDNGVNMFCRTLEVSGTSLVGGTEVQFNNQFGYYPNASYNPTANKFIIGYYNDTATGGVETGYHLIAGSVSGSTITLGTAIKQGVNVSSNTVYDPTSGQSYLQGAARNYYWVLSFSGNDVSIIVSNIVIDTDQYPGNVGANLFGNSTLRIWLYRSSSTSRPVVLGQKPFAPSFVGIAKENISNGATGKVTVAGGINTSVSGLTTGKQFGLPTTATVITEISLVDPQANRIFGTALSSTSIYLDKGNLR